MHEDPSIPTEYLEHHNADPKSFIWTAPVNDILEKVA